MTGGTSFVSRGFEGPAAQQRRLHRLKITGASRRSSPLEGNLPGSGSGAPSGTNDVCHPVMSGGLDASATCSHAGQRGQFFQQRRAKNSGASSHRNKSAPEGRRARKARDADRNRAQAPLALAKLFRTRPAVLRSTSVSATSAITSRSRERRAPGASELPRPPAFRAS